MTDINRQVEVAFARNAKRVVIFLAGFAIVAFGVGSEALLEIQADRALAIRVETYRAALAARSQNELADSVARLQSCTNGLLGVAILSESNDIQRVYPDDPLHLDLAQQALERAGTTFNVSLPSESQPVRVYGAWVDLPQGSAAEALHALILIRRVSYWTSWLKALLLVSAGVSAMAALRFYTLNRWFKRQVVQPLREFGRLNLDPLTGLMQLPSLEAGDWIETTQIAKQFESLLRSLNDSDARVRRLEQENRRQILHKEVGFDLKLKRAKDEATIDALTKLRNRAFLECDLEPLFARQREKEAPLSAVMMDVDNFKRYNDTHGHQAGDSLLRFIGSLLRGGIRPIDYAVRYGGDEFLLLLPDIPAQDAAIVADRLIKLFAQYAGKLSRDCGVSMSAGVASVHDDECETGHDLVKHADAALYTAKNGGKNAVALGDPKKPNPLKSTPIAGAAPQAM